MVMFFLIPKVSAHSPELPSPPLVTFKSSLVITATDRSMP